MGTRVRVHRRLVIEELAPRIAPGVLPVGIAEDWAEPNNTMDAAVELGLLPILEMGFAKHPFLHVRPVAGVASDTTSGLCDTPIFACAATAGRLASSTVHSTDDRCSRRAVSKSWPELTNIKNTRLFPLGFHGLTQRCLHVKFLPNRTIPRTALRFLTIPSSLL